MATIKETANHYSKEVSVDGDGDFVIMQWSDYLFLDKEQAKELQELLVKYLKDEDL